MADQEEYPGAEDEPSSEQAKAEPSSPADSPGFSLNVLEKSQPNVKHENPRSGTYDTWIL
jgi:hypothetical protein